VTRTPLPLLGLVLLGPGCAPSESRPAALASARPFLERSAELDPRTTNAGRWIEDLAFTDVDGRPGRLSEHAGRPLVIAVRDVGCPVSQRTARALARIEDAYRPRGVTFLFLNESAHNTVAEVRADAAEHGFEGRSVHDSEQRLGTALGATTTTEVFVLDGARTLVYRGAIDDQVGRGTVRVEAEHAYLRDALEQTLAHARVDVPATTAPGCLLGIDPEAAPVPDSPSYHREVARILRDNCVECHRAGGVAPFSLESHADARGRRAMIRLVLEDDVMPPWFAAPGTGPWQDERRLSEWEEGTLLAWIEDGAPEGDPAETPLHYSYPDGWSIGTPDLVFRMKEPFPVPAEGVVDLRYFEVTPEVPEDLWIQRLEVRPGARAVVHHVTVSYQAPRADPGAWRNELRAALLPFARGPNDGWVFLFGHLPGKGPHSYPEGMACFLPQGARLRFDMHYTPNGRAVSDQTSLGIVLAKEPPELVAETRNFWNRDVAIPPFEPAATFTRDYPLHHDVFLRTLTPHMHLRGRSMVAELLRPDGARELLIDVPAWDPGWQFDYTFREPRFAPAGSRVRVTAAFDNSPENPANPDPSLWVRDGPQTTDEMMSLLVEWFRPRLRE
jgi:hypothetical protein